MKDLGSLEYVYQTPQARAVIAYVREQYGDELEFLWRATPEDAVWRTRANGKWYGILFALSARKLGKDDDDWLEVMNVRYPKGRVDEVVDGERILPGYHMNKQNWITIILDGQVTTAEVLRLLDQSYRIALNKR